MSLPPILLAVALHGGDCVTQSAAAAPLSMPATPTPSHACTLTGDTGAPLPPARLTQADVPAPAATAQPDAPAVAAAPAAPAATPALQSPPAPNAPTASPVAAPGAGATTPATTSPAPGAALAPGQPGTIVVSGKVYRGWTTDPLEGPNKISFAVISKADDLVVGPVAHAYTHVLPGPLRDGLHNILNLLEEPTVFVNDLLQLHPGRAAKTLARTVINVGMGWGGLFDVSGKVFKMPFRDNGFANTMGYYGVKPGPYLFAPLIGSTTVRDLAGRMMDLSLLSTTVGFPFNNPTYATARGTLASVDYRVQIDGDLKRIRAQSNPYLAAKQYYLSLRQAEIDELHGHKAKLPAIWRDSPFAPADVRTPVVAPNAAPAPLAAPAAVPATPAPAPATTPAPIPAAPTPAPPQSPPAAP